MDKIKLDKIIRQISHIFVQEELKQKDVALILGFFASTTMDKECKEFIKNIIDGRINVNRDNYN